VTPADAIRATLVSACHPGFHGAPVSLGLPEDLGIASLEDSYGGHGVKRVLPGELPVFWPAAPRARMRCAPRACRSPLPITRPTWSSPTCLCQRTCHHEP
jgi:uncharacterized protein YcsI (UPF0317 family)